MDAPPNYHALSADDALGQLTSGRDGLSDQEASDRLTRIGPNALTRIKPPSVWGIVLHQLRSVVVLLLVVAVGVSLVVGDPLDAMAIGAVLVLNTALGAYAELRARRAMTALLHLESPHAVVVRGGQSREIDARELVPGDVVEMGAGQSVPADLRIIDASELHADQAALTGESIPVAKQLEPVANDALIPERSNILYQGTVLTTGNGRGVVFATGDATELGKIGGLMAGIRDEPTPLERRLDALGRRMAWVALAVAAIVVGIGLLRGMALAELIQTGIALAIAAVPEGLPAVATIALAAGMRRMARRKALVRRLPSVETLGSVTVICTDKTGTLTAGEMTLATMLVGGREVSVTGSGYGPDGGFSADGQPITPNDDAVLTLALRIGALANRAEVGQRDGKWSARGDTTEAALLVAARKAGLDRETLRQGWPEEGEVPFSSKRKLMATFHRSPDGLVAYVKGAPGRIIELSTRVASAGGDRDLDDAGRKALLERNLELAGRGMRVLALAYTPASQVDEAALVGLTFVGLVGLIDPPADGVRDTIRVFRDAGIRTVMLTGDQQRTAEAIARDLGILVPPYEVVDGRELNRSDRGALAHRLANVAAFSRVSPENKLDIVTAFQAQGEIVAMLGDGVNDAPALKKADVGVAMGTRGTDVAKEAASVVLQDDRFQTIGAAIEEGRVIFDNIRKFVFYLFSCNVAEILVLMVAGIAGLPLPLLPVQILWLNLVTDTFPALALAFEPAEADVMRRPPRRPADAIFSASFLREVVLFAALLAMVTLAAFWWGLREGGDPRRAITLTFMTLAFAQTFHLVNARRHGAIRSLQDAFSNRYALGAVILVAALQLAAVYVPPLARALHTFPLTGSDWAVVVLVALIPAAVGQTYKAVVAGGERHRA